MTFHELHSLVNSDPWNGYYVNPHITTKLGSTTPCQIGKTTWKLQYMPIIHQPYSLKSCLDIGILAVLDWTNRMAWNFAGCNSSWQKVEANFGSFSDSCWDLKVSFYKNYRRQHLEILESYTMENLPSHMSVMCENKKHSLSVKIRQRGRINPRQAILYRKSGSTLHNSNLRKQ